MRSSLSRRIYHTLRVDRALKLVWESGRRRTVISGIVLFISGLLPIISLYLIKLIIDTVVEMARSGADAEVTGRILLLLAGAVGAAVVSSLVGALAGWLEEVQSQVVTDHVHDVLERKSVSADLSYYEDPAYHDTLHRAQSEAPYRPSEILSQLFSLLYSLVALAGVGVLLAVTFHWVFVLVLVATAIPVLFVRMRFSEELFRWHKSRTNTERRVAYLNFVLTGTWYAKEVRTYGLGALFSGRSRQLRDKLRGERLKIAGRRTTIDVVTRLSQTIVLFGSFGYVVVQALRGAQSVGDIVMLYQAFQRGQGLLQSLVGSLSSLYENNLFLSYLYDFLDLPRNVTSPSNPVAVPSSITQGITVKGVTFGYRVGSDRVLDNVHMELPRGKIVALTGENGAGKSTLLRILGRLYDPTRGSVLLDGTDIRQFELDAFRSMVGVLFQDASSYFEPARENVRYGNLDGEHATPGAPRAVETAAREAGADAFISELPRGYDTVLGTWFDDGVELSIGQWKKIALARLFYSERPILLLDEPTSSLDAGSESNIMRQLREKVEDRVILVVSHRLSTVSAADLIYVLREGAIVEHGSHDALIRHDGAYAALCREQALT